MLLQWFYDVQLHGKEAEGSLKEAPSAHFYLRAYLVCCDAILFMCLESRLILTISSRSRAPVQKQRDH